MIEDDSAAKAYRGMVAEIVASTPRDSDYVPEHPMDLRIVRRRAPQSPDELEPDEREQLAAVLGADLATVLSPDHVEDDFPLNVEVAAVVDETGAVRYRLYAWGFGVSYLMPPSGLDVVAMGTQHDLEHWHIDQRPVFWAMDRAYSRGDHGFKQPLVFNWWEQGWWDEIEGEPRGTVRSEPWVREQLAQAVRRIP